MVTRRNQAKARTNVDWSLRGTAIGCDFDGAEGYLDANAPKQVQTIYDTVMLLADVEIKPDTVMQVMGSLQWFDLLARS